ncbi:MAG: hypothetical protein Q8865_08175 [Bacillota bacterium]|nr:hypothetical protein [Bacillota bacterium]
MKNPKTAFILSFFLTVVFLAFLALMAVANDSGLLGDNGQPAFKVFRANNATNITVFNENLKVSDSVTQPIINVYESGARFYSSLIPGYLKESGRVIVNSAKDAYGKLPELAEKFEK